MSGTVSTAAELTTEWLTTALAPALDGAEVTSVQAEPVGSGQVSDSLRLTLAYSRPAGLPATMIAKIPSAAEASRQAARVVRTYEIEAKFYEVVAPTLDASIPACHYVAYDAETDHYVVLLEDLAPAAPGDQLAGLDLADASASVEELAVLHAAGWENPALAALDWLNRHDPAAVEFTAEMVTGMYAGFRDRYKHDLAPETITAIEEFLPRMASYLTDRQGPATLTHGDFRADNLLFGGARPAVLDWQTCAFGSGSLDLAYFLGSSLPTTARREHERSLVQRYHAVLTERGVELGWDECWDGYRKHAFQGIVMGIGASMLVERTERGDRMFCTMIDRHASHIIDLDCLSLLP